MKAEGGGGDEKWGGMPFLEEDQKVKKKERHQAKKNEDVALMGEKNPAEEKT